MALSNSDIAVFITTIVTAVATLVVAAATVIYARLVYKQVRLGEPRVIAFVATKNGRPMVNVTNAGASTAYEVALQIDWPVPPLPIKGEASSDESPVYGTLASGDVLHFLSPHDFNLADNAVAGSPYSAQVHIAYRSAGARRRRNEVCMVDFAGHIEKMRQVREIHP